MKILYYDWGENSADDMIQTFQNLGYEVTVFRAELDNYFIDEAFSDVLMKELAKDCFDFIFTFNFFPIISDTAERLSMKYVCWVYDCAHYTLYSKSISNACNYIFLFDKAMVVQVCALGAVHAYHLPLAANTARINSALSITPNNYHAPEHFLHEISFVGSLYEKNLYDNVNFLPQKLIGYLDGIMYTQKQLWGMDLVSQLVDEALSDELEKYIKLENNPQLPNMNRTIFATMLQSKITSDERITALNLLAEFFPTALYSASPSSLCPKADSFGTISYIDTMPSIFYSSKINLNITLRSITSGIPLRAIDILSCGGFLLTNYQPELCEYFEAGTDFIYFEDLEDMLTKADYFLRHDEERMEIAANGYRKANQAFSYETQVQRLLELIK